MTDKIYNTLFICTFLSLPLARIGRLSLQNQLREMGQERTE